MMHCLLGGNESKREVYMIVSNVGASFGPDVAQQVTISVGIKKNWFSQNFLSQDRENFCGTPTSN